MNHNLQTYHLMSERRKTLVVLLINAIAALALIFVLLLPAKRRAENLRSDIDGLSDRIASLKNRRSLPTGALLQKTKQQIESLEHRWEIVRFRADTFKKGSFLDKMEPGASNNRIDFKVALYEAQEKLLAGAIAAETGLPQPLSLEESVSQDGNASLKMWQLASIMKILSTIMRHNAVNIHHVKALGPQKHYNNDASSGSAYELPLAVSFEIDFADLARLIDHSLSNENFLAFRAINIEKQTRHPSQPLHVDAIIAAEHLGVDPVNFLVLPKPVMKKAD